VVTAIRKPGDRPVRLDVPTSNGGGPIRWWVVVARLSVGFRSARNGRADTRRFCLELRPGLDAAASQSASGSRCADRPALIQSRQFAVRRLFESVALCVLEN
jgi:hypothetical protein